ncbi:hypothetical protein GLW05_09755 [Pontibacillus yanchengensis]|uniref:Uncharacterized protein n=1 Tax=Pontibacillus yanchengensis TaxID=462910 RepID=A0A6I5A0U6_9BACI|nr:hypothetical protein [Pontibacillus yanchengensis]MYL33883.1 hypothetical protein [Pontibacillus yanchengensis]
MYKWLFLLLPLSLLGCSMEVTSSTEEKHIETIKHVLEKLFTGPDQELVELFEEPENVSVIGREGESSSTESPTELDRYLEDQYKPYFTTNMYERFIGIYAMNYPLKSYASDYQLRVGSIEVDQIESTEGVYDFTVHVMYGKDGMEEKEKEVEGRVNVNDEGKISNIEILDDHGLSEKLK